MEYTGSKTLFFLIGYCPAASPCISRGCSCLYRQRVAGTEATASKHCQAVFAVGDYWELLGSSFRIVTEAAPERAVVSLLKVRVKEVWVGA